MNASEFRNPGKQYRPAPFWSWNGTLTPEEAQRQIKLMHEQGFGGFFMHSRVGLETPYMGEEWMQAVSTSIAAAIEYDMEAWFYDEDKWPSGFAGGMVPALGDAYRIKGLGCNIGDAATISAAWQNPPAGCKPGSLRVLYQLEMADDQLAGFTQLTAAPASSAPGTYMLCQLLTASGGQARYNGESYVDLLDSQVTEAFIKCTHEAYKARFGHLFGPHAPGIFTDEPNVSPISGSVSTPWTTLLPQRFRELWGYNIVDRLPELFLPGVGSAQVRHDYWATVTILFRDNFTKPFGAWCEANGIQMTGHMLREDNPVTQVIPSGACMPHYPYMQLPGIDHLGRNINDALTLKQVTSVAHQMGRTRVLCEIFGTAGHSMSFADQKWIADFHFALGITFLNQHLMLYSMVGERKRDYPANISWAQPYWEDYRIFNDYASRCSWFTQRGEYKASTLLLHPISSIWAQLPAKSEHPGYTEALEATLNYGNRFLEVMDALLAAQRDFDLGDELVMADFATVEGQTFKVGQMQYRTVVLPYCTVLEPTTTQLLTKFLANGGQVIYVADAAIAAQGEQVTRLPGVKQVNDAAELLAHLDATVERQLTITDLEGRPAPQILFQHRVQGERSLYFLASKDAKAGHTLRIQLPVQGDVTVFDPTTGAVELLEVGKASAFTWAHVEVLEQTAAGVTLQWHVAPAGSLLLNIGAGLDETGCDTTVDSLGDGAIANAQAAGYPGVPGGLPTDATETLAGPWEFDRLHPNVMTLDYCHATIAGEPFSPEQQPTAVVREAVLKACGMNTNIQPYRYLTHQEPSQTVRVQLEYLFNIEEIPATLALVVEQPEKQTISVNGQLVTKPALNAQGENLATEWLHDPGFGALDIQPLVQVGENRIILTFTAGPAGAEVEEIYLLGSFGVWQRDTDFVVGLEPETLRPGSWVEQGYPFYTGTMRYKLPVDGKQRWLDLSGAAASLLRIAVNSEQPKALPWRPWVVDLQGYLQPGMNTVAVDVVSSLQNAFGPLHHQRSRTLSWVGPGDFRANPKFWTDEYQFTPYGLLEPVRVR
jgi:hypothetical protein